jgi:hypothetical protein
VDDMNSKHTHLTSIALTVGPLVTVAGMALTPWETVRTTAGYQAALLAHPVQAQWAAVTLVFGYSLMALASLAVLRRSERAPRPLVILASIAAFCGGAILPGMVTVDFYDLALAQHLTQAQAVAVADQANDASIGIILHIVAGIGYVGGSLLVLATAWRARLVGGWAPLLALASFVVPGLVLPGGTGITIAAALILLAFVGVAAGVRSGRADRVAARREHRATTLDASAQPAEVVAA